MRRLVFLLGLALLLAGCGGATHTVVTVVTETATTANTAQRLALATSIKPTACTDYLSEHDAEVESVSTVYRVSPVCQSFVQSNARAGTLWTLQPPQIIPIAALESVCSLSSDSGVVTASVVDSGTQASGQAACNGLISAGWRSAFPSAQPPITNIKPAAQSPTFAVPKVEGDSPGAIVEPANIYFSGDGGNVATGITWSTWSQARAVGTGTSIIQNCDPSCAQGSQVEVNITITLLDPVDGHYTQLLESRNGITTLASYDAPISQAAGFDYEDWPLAVNSSPTG